MNHLARVVELGDFQTAAYMCNAVSLVVDAEEEDLKHYYESFIEEGHDFANSLTLLCESGNAVDTTHDDVPADHGAGGLTRVERHRQTLIGYVFHTLAFFLPMAATEDASYIGELRQLVANSHFWDLSSPECLAADTAIVKLQLGYNLCAIGDEGVAALAACQDCFQGLATLAIADEWVDDLEYYSRFLFPLRILAACGVVDDQARQLLQNADVLAPMFKALRTFSRVEGQTKPHEVSTLSVIAATVTDLLRARVLTADAFVEAVGVPALCDLALFLNGLDVATEVSARVNCMAYMAPDVAFATLLHALDKGLTRPLQFPPRVSHVITSIITVSVSRLEHGADPTRDTSTDTYSILDNYFLLSHDLRMPSWDTTAAIVADWSARMQREHPSPETWTAAETAAWPQSSRLPLDGIVFPNWYTVIDRVPVVPGDPTRVCPGCANSATTSQVYGHVIRLPCGCGTRLVHIKCVLEVCRGCSVDISDMTATALFAAISPA